MRIQDKKKATQNIISSSSSESTVAWVLLDGLSKDCRDAVDLTGGVRFNDPEFLRFLGVIISSEILSSSPAESREFPLLPASRSQ